MMLAFVSVVAMLAAEAAEPALPPQLSFESAAAPDEESEPRPFDDETDAGADVDAALATAEERGTHVLLVLGGNWCHDSRGLAEKFETPDLATLIAEKYELVWVDVGRRERNLDIAKRFGVHDLLGTPTILIVSAEGELLNADTVHDWRNADSRSLEETLAYFTKWSPAHGQTD